jgi:predicted transcriptional regulator
MIYDEASMISFMVPDAIAMAETLKDRVMFTAPQGTKERLKAWAESERRTISNLCEKVVLEALEQWEECQKAQDKEGDRKS